MWGSKRTDFGASEVLGALSASFSFLEERHDVFMAEPFSHPRRATDEPPCLAWDPTMLQQQLDDFRVAFIGCCVQGSPPCEVFGIHIDRETGTF